jgi:hypothetical protein
MKPCPLYESLLADKDLDEEMRMMILKRIAEDEREIAADKASAKRRRAKALADLSLLNPDPSLQAGEMARRLPDAANHAPRDGKKIGETADFLFLATLLDHSQESQTVLQCAPKSGTGEWILIAGENPPEGFLVKQRLSHKGIRRIFRDKVYGFRRALGSPEAACMNFSIGGVDIRRAGGRGDKAFWHFASRLYHPFHQAGDNLLDSLHSRRLLDFSETSHDDLFLCPLDGPVNAISGKVSSPDWTWEKMVGRSWSIALCPMCLGELATTGYSLS